MAPTKMSPKFRLTLLKTAGVIIMGVLGSLLVNAISNEPGMQTLTGKLGTKWLWFALAVITVLSILCHFTLEHYKEKSLAKAGAENREAQFEARVQGFFKSLLNQYDERHFHKIDGRFEIPLEAIAGWQKLNGEEPHDSPHNRKGDALTLINEAFEKNGHVPTVIVGGPGIGKTVLMLNFARARLTRSSHSDHPFPLILNLASWSSEYRTVNEWITAFLDSGYGLPKDVAQRLLEERRFTFLFDGLDELGRNESDASATLKRSACLAALNNYLVRGQKAILSCGTTQFAQLQNIDPSEASIAPRMLAASEKIFVRDMTRDRIEDAILGALYRVVEGKKIDQASAERLLRLLENDVFLEVIQKPFYFATALDIFDQPVMEDEGLARDIESLQNYLIEKFTKKTLQLTDNKNNFAEADTRRWLCWLANWMTRKKAVNFELSLLQPSDLSQRWSYYVISSTFALLYIGIMIGIGALVLFRTMRSLLLGLLLGLLFAVFVGLVQGLFKGLEFFIKEKIKSPAGDDVEFTPDSLLDRRWWRRVVAEGLFRGLVAGLILGGIVGIITGPIVGLIAGIIVCVIGAVVKGLNAIKTPEGIKTRNAIQIDFSKVLDLNFWRDSLFSEVRGCLTLAVLGGLMFVVGQAIIAGRLSLSDSISKFLLILSLGLALALIAGMASAFEKLKTKASYANVARPYQLLLVGCAHNLKYASLMSLISICFFTLYSPRSQPRSSFLITLAILIGFSLCASLERLSNQPLSQHLVLRLALHLERSMPLRYRTFLNYAAALRILERDGGLWRFRHANLQEYFAGEELRLRMSTGEN